MTDHPPDLFRPEALQYHLHAGEGRGLVRVSPPWTWVLLLALLSGLGTAILASLFGRVEVNGRGRAILRPVSGVRMVLAKVDGTVGRIEVRSGQFVEAGAPLVQIEAPPVQAQLHEARRQAESVRKHFKRTGQLQDQAHAEQASASAMPSRLANSMVASAMPSGGVMPAAMAAAIGV